MRQLKSQNQIERSSFAHRRFVSSAVLLLLFLVALTVHAQTPVAPPAEVKTTANLAAATVTPALPVIPDTTKDNDSNTTDKPENKPVLIVENLIHNGDIIDVDVLGSLEYDWRGKADDEGFLSNPPYFSVYALCRTEPEIASEVTAAYSKLIRNPQIVIRVLDRSARQPAILFGAVHAPQRFQIERSVRLEELIVMTGGITDQASGEIKIFRPAHVSCSNHNQTQAESYVTIKLTDLLAGKTAANPLIRSGDIVTIEEAAPIYVTGGVNAPQQILFRQGMTLSRAVASAGGLSRNADQSRITIYRRQTNRSDLKIIEADFAKITRHTAEDIPLEAYDIVEVFQTGGGRRGNRQPPIVPHNESQQFDISKLPLRLIG